MAKLSLKIEHPENTKHINMVLYGATGCGKTYLSGSAQHWPGTSPALLIDIEGGALTLHDYAPDIDVIRITNWKDLQELYGHLRNDNTKYKSVIIDSVTELQRKVSMGNILGDLEGDDAYSDLEKSTPPNRADWLRSSEQMRKVLRAFRDLSYLPTESRRLHVIFTALEKYNEPQSTVCPQLPGALGMECGAFTDLLCRLSIVEVTDPDTGQKKQRRHLLTSEYTAEDGTRYLAKNRGGRLGTTVWDPTIEKLLGVWSDDRPVEERPEPVTEEPESEEVLEKIEDKEEELVEA